MRDDILIADDAAFMRRLIRTYLSDSGFEHFLEAKDGEDAVKIYKKERPGIVFMDITMPEKSGIEALADILKADPEATVIMCSAIGQDKTIEQALEIGAVDYLVKPFKKEALAEIARKYQ